MNKNAKGRSYLDILRFYSKDENQQGVHFSGGVGSPVGLQSGHSFCKGVKKERFFNVRNWDGADSHQGNDDRPLGEDKESLNTDSFFRTLFCNQKMGSSNNRHYTSGCYRSNPFEEEENNNAQRRNLKKMVTYATRGKRVKPVHEEDTLIRNLRREQRMRMLCLQKEHGCMKGYQKKMASCFAAYRRRKTCTICFLSNNTEHMEKCKNCSLHFHVYCYKMFRDNFNLSDFVCDVCVDCGAAGGTTSNFAPQHVPHRAYAHQRTDEPYRKYHFAYKRKDVDVTNEPLDCAPQVEEPNTQSGSPRKSKNFKCLSEAEFGNSNDLLHGEGNQKINGSSKRKAEGGKKIPTDDCLYDGAIHHRDMAYHSDTRCNRRVSHEIGPYNKKAKRQLKKRADLEMTSEKVTKMVGKLLRPLENHKMDSHSMLFQMEQSQSNQPPHEGKNTQYMHAIQYKLHLHERASQQVKCSICNGLHRNVLMIRTGPDLWFHVCCLYYNDLSKCGSLNHLYFECFFLKFYNQDYFSNMYGKLKGVNEIIVQKVKQELLSSYNTTIHSHSFNFLMNPYYYNLTLKQIKNLIFYNFILQTNVLYGRKTSWCGGSSLQVSPIGGDEGEGIIKGVLCTNLGSDNLAEMNFGWTDRRRVSESSSCAQSNRRRRNSQRGSQSRIDLHGKLYNQYEHSSSLSSEASSYVGSSSIPSCSDSSSDGATMRDDTQDMEEGEYEDEPENDPYVDDDEEDISMHCQNEHTNIYCIDTNNCSVVTEENYYTTDVLHIVSNHTRNEVSLSVNKQNELNSFFKEIEQLIYKRDFIHLNILKNIKEKIQESVLNNHSKICVFCKKATGIKTKCMFPSCCTYFHISCYYEFFLHSVHVIYEWRRGIKRDDQFNRRQVNQVTNPGDLPPRTNKPIKRQDRRKKRLRNGIGSDKSDQDNVCHGIYVDRCDHAEGRATPSAGVAKNILTKGNSQEQPPIDAPKGTIQYIRKIKRKIMDSSEQQNGGSNNSAAVVDGPTNGSAKMNQKNTETKMTPIIFPSPVEHAEKTNPRAKKEVVDLASTQIASSGATTLEDQPQKSKVTVDAREGNTVGYGQEERVEDKSGNPTGGGSSQGSLLSTRRTRSKAVVVPLSNTQKGSFEEGKVNQTVRSKSNHHPNEQNQMVVLDNLKQNTVKTTPCKNTQMGDPHGRRFTESTSLCSDVNIAGMNRRNQRTVKHCSKYPARDYVTVGGIPRQGEKPNVRMHKLVQRVTHQVEQKTPLRGEAKLTPKVTPKITPKTRDRSDQPGRPRRGDDCESFSSLSSLLCSSIPSDGSESSFDSIRSSDRSLSLHSKSNSISLHSLTFSSASSSSSSTYASSECVANTSRQIASRKWDITSSCSSSDSSVTSKLNGKAKSISSSLSAASNRSCRNSNSPYSSNSQEALSSSCGEGFPNTKLGYNMGNSNNRHHTSANSGNAKRKKKKKIKKKKYEHSATDTEHLGRNTTWNKLGLFTTNVSNVGNSYLEMKSIKLTLCNTHNNEDDIATVLNLKLNAVNNRGHNNLGGIFYHYYNSFLSSVFFAEKFAHLSNGGEDTNEWVDNQVSQCENESGNLHQGEKEDEIKEVSNTPVEEQNNRGEAISTDNDAAVNPPDGETHKPSDHTHKRKIGCLSETPNCDDENEQKEMGHSEQHDQDDTDVAQISRGNKKKKVKLDNGGDTVEHDANNVERNDGGRWRDEAHTEGGSSDRAEDKKGENEPANELEVTTDYENSPTQEKANGYDTLKDVHEEKSNQVEGAVEGTAEPEEATPNGEVTCKETPSKANHLTLLLFMNYMNRVIDNVEASVIMKNNVCEGVYYLRQQNGVNICQKVSGRLKKQLKAQNMKKKKKKKKKKLSEITILKNTNVDIQKKDKNNISSSMDLKKKVDVNKFAYLFYRLPLLLSGNKFVSDLDTLKCIGQIRSVFHYYVDFSNSRNIANLVELLEGYASHSMFHKSVSNSRRSLHDREDKSGTRRKLSASGVSVETATTTDVTTVAAEAVEKALNQDAEEQPSLDNSFDAGGEDGPDDAAEQVENADEQTSSTATITEVAPTEEVRKNEPMSDHPFENEKESITENGDTDLVRGSTCASTVSAYCPSVVGENHHDVQEDPHEKSTKTKKKKKKKSTGSGNNCKGNMPNESVLEQGDSFNLEDGQRNENNTCDKGGITKGDESGKESQPYVNKSFNLVFCLFDNGNNIYLLIYESDSDNRKKYAKNKLLRKKNECNNIDYFFRELYEKVHQSSSKDGAFSILKALFCNGVGASVGDSSASIASGVIPQSAIGFTGLSDVTSSTGLTGLTSSMGSMWSMGSMSGTSNRSGSGSRVSGHRVQGSSNANSNVSTVNATTGISTVCGTTPDELNCLKMSEMLLNKNVLENILHNFSAFNITKNLSLKLANVIELTYYDYLFIKRHKFFYSKRGVKIFDACNNLYGEGEPTEDDLGGSVVGGSVIGGSVVGGSVIDGCGNRDDYQLTNKLKEILSKLYSDKGSNNTSFNYRGMLCGESSLSGTGDVSRVSAYVKEEKAKLGGVVTPMGISDVVAAGCSGGITDWRNVNPFLWGPENSTFAGSVVNGVPGDLSGTTMMAYEFAKNGNLLNKGVKEKVLNKQITKKNDKRDKKDGQRSKNKKEQKNRLHDDPKSCNTSGGKLPSGNTITKSEFSQYSNLDLVTHQSRDNSINGIVREFLLNGCEDNTMAEQVKEIIGRYNSFGGNTKSGFRGKCHPAEGSMYSTNSFSAYDVYKLFLLDNGARGGETNTTMGDPVGDPVDSLTSGEGTPPGATNEPEQAPPLFKNKEERKKYLNNILFDKATLNNFRSFILKKRQMEFFYKNWNGLANCIERENNFIDIGNILSFHLNRSNFVKQLNWRSVEEVETKVNLSRSSISSVSGVKIKAEENKAGSFAALPGNCTKDGNNAIEEGANSSLCKSEPANGSPPPAEDHAQQPDGEKNNENDEKDASGTVVTVGDDKSGLSEGNVLPPVVKEEKNIQPDLSNRDESEHKGEDQTEDQTEGQKESQTESQNYRNRSRSRDGESFDELIGHNYEKMKDLYNNLNEEIVKNKLLLMSKIIDENHFYNVADMPLYVNLVFYKYSCVNTWNNLVHNLRDSFLREEEAHFLTTNGVMNKNVAPENGLNEAFILTPTPTTLPTKEALPEEHNPSSDACVAERKEEKHHHNDDNGKAPPVGETVTTQYSNNPVGKENGPEEGNKMGDQSSEAAPPSGVGPSTSVVPPAVTDPKKSAPIFNQKKNEKNEKNGKNVKNEEKEKPNHFTCSVCFNYQLNNINILYKCVGCFTYMHKYCYGIYQKGRSDEFLCEKCTLSKYINKRRQQGEDPSKSSSHSKKKKKSSNNSAATATGAGTVGTASVVAAAAVSSGHTHDCNTNDPCDNPSKSTLDVFKGFESCCYICKKDGGALKKTTTNQFVHIFCVLFFISKVFCLNIYNLNLWDVSNLRSFENVCCICNKNGAVIRCAYCEEDAQGENTPSSANTHTKYEKKEKKCNKWFHPLCAYLEGYHMNVEIYEDLFVMTYFYDNCFSCFHVITHCNDHVPPGSYQNREAVKWKRNKSYLSSSSGGEHGSGNNDGAASPKSSDGNIINMGINNFQSGKIETNAPCLHNQQNGSSSTPPLQNCVNAILVKEETSNEICATEQIEEACAL
ncbi:Uncharacterized protein PCOAH_00020310 [Plasmodium coatneyi]|uniref:Zinc finger PHD-type domain-containing protein n=1 Tax=Plasmodium coatneyi TaxID=208452 RepID=A0A1B1DY58_9APIC|nr:Uncharacterized protein PCOAH_00020310 [Plasmodium coatneyi]ANQ07722.1 Uncharacterized protein PCOAH_00020310 [Plasmodium coatneyi]